VLAPPVAAERDHMRMFAQQQHIGNRALLARLNHFLLEMAGRVIRRQAKMNDPAGFLFLCHVNVRLQIDLSECKIPRQEAALKAKY
jgi:hypothetical protein